MPNPLTRLVLLLAISSSSRSLRLLGLLVLRGLVLGVLGGRLVLLRGVGGGLILGDLLVTGEGSPAGGGVLAGGLLVVRRRRRRSGGGG